MPLNAASETKLKGVKADLAKVARRAAEISPQPFQIVQGVRTQAEQNALYAQGRTKPGQIVTWTKNSKHLGGNAVDFAALVNGKISWTTKYYPAVANAFSKAASELGVAIERGIDWKTKDWGHIQVIAKASGTGTTTADPLLKRGSKAVAVLEAQKLLAKHGFPLVADQNFGAATEKAVRAFQAAKGLLVDGKVGQLTWDALRLPAAPVSPAPESARVTSTAGRKLIQEYEGLSLVAYQDGKNLAIGYGHNNGSNRPPFVIAGMRITQAHAEGILASDLKSYEAAVLDAVTAPVTQGQFDALVSLAYNKGPGWLKGSTLLKKVNAGRNAEAAAEIVKAVPAAGSIYYNGLLRRRKAEAALFTSAPELEPPASAIRVAIASSITPIVQPERNTEMALAETVREVNVVPWYESKINWVSIIGIAAQAGNFLGVVSLDADTQLQIAAGLGALQGLLTGVLKTWTKARAVSSQPV